MCSYENRSYCCKYFRANSLIGGLKDHLNEYNCVTILTDALNHGTKKIFSVLILFFWPYEGIQVKLLELQDQASETSEIILSYLMKVLTENNLTSKVVAFCGDNTNYILLWKYIHIFMSIVLV